MTDNLQTAAAQPAPPTNNGVLPLETLWPTPKSLLEGYSRQAKALADSLKKSRPTQPPSEVLAVPGAQEAPEGLEEAMNEGRRLLLAAARTFERLAGTTRAYPPVPWCAEAQRAEFLSANARQKNERGYCGHLGCWQPMLHGGRCPDQESRLEPPASDPLPDRYP